MKPLEESFGRNEGLKKVTDMLWLDKVLPTKFVEVVGKKMGLTIPKPDFTYGLAKKPFPDPNQANPGRTAEAYINLAPEVHYPFFAFECGSCEKSPEQCENQAIGDGATMVEAMRQLDILAGSINEDTEPLGPDSINIAFTCVWVPKIAEIHVNWFERTKPGKGGGIYHMNRLSTYLQHDAAHVSNFRHDTHNILDYGVAKGRKDQLASLYTLIAERNEKGANPPSTSSGISTSASVSQPDG
ncbi:MAG: hypothetical protein Q9217_007083 [Psora testacea]